VIEDTPFYHSSPSIQYFVEINFVSVEEGGAYYCTMARPWRQRSLYFVDVWYLFINCLEGLENFETQPDGCKSGSGGNHISGMDAMSG